MNRQYRQKKNWHVLRFLYETVASLCIGSQQTICRWYGSPSRICLPQGLDARQSYSKVKEQACKATLTIKQSKGIYIRHSSITLLPLTCAVCSSTGSYYTQIQTESEVFPNMTSKTTIIKHRYIPPKSFRKPAHYALKLYRKGGLSFTQSIDIAIKSYTSDPKADDYVSPKILTHNALRKHVAKIILSDWRL